MMAEMMKSAAKFDQLEEVATNLERLSETTSADFRSKDTFAFFVENFKDGNKASVLLPAYKKLYTSFGCTTRDAFGATIWDMAQNGKGKIVKRFEAAEKAWDQLLFEVDDAINNAIFTGTQDQAVDRLSGELRLVDCDNFKTVRVEDLLIRKFGRCTLFVMLRFFGCPQCYCHVAELQQRAAELRARLCNVVVVCKATKEGGAKFRRLAGIDFPVLADEHLDFVRALKFKASVWNVCGTAMMHKKASLAARGTPYTLKHYIDDPLHDIYQLGGDVLVDNQGKILYAHRSETSFDRLTVDQILSKIPTTNDRQRRTSRAKSND